MARTTRFQAYCQQNTHKSVPFTSYLQSLDFIFFFIPPTFLFSLLNPLSIWTQRCNCRATRFCHLHVASSHFSSFSGLTLLYLAARNEIIRRVDEKLTCLLHLPVALSDGCHSNHYATEQTRWVKDSFKCGSLGSQPGYDRTNRSLRGGCKSLLAQSTRLHSSRLIRRDFQLRLKLLKGVTVLKTLKKPRQVLILKRKSSMG